MLAKILSSPARSFIVSLFIIAFFSLMGINLINSAPQVKLLEAVYIKPNKSGITLGYQELGQQKGANSAAKEHLLVKKDDKHIWQFQNISATKRVDAKTSKIDTRYIRRTTLKKGDQLIFNTFQLLVKQADDQKLVLFNSQTNETAIWNGKELVVNNSSGYPSCERQGLRRVLGDISDKFHWLIKNNNPQQTLRLFTLGGQVHCTTRWKLPDLAADSARIYWQNGNYWIGSGSESTRILIKTSNKNKNLKKLLLSVNDKTSKEGKIERIILGRTYYKVSSSNNILKLTPVLNQQAFQINPLESNTDATETDEIKQEKHLKQIDEENKRLKEMQLRGVEPKFKQHHWIGESLKANPFRYLSLMTLAGLLIFTVIFSFTIYHWKKRIQGKTSPFPILISTGVTLLLSWLAVAWKGEVSTLLSLLMITTTWASLILGLNGKLQKISAILWLLILLLGGIGTLTLTQLAAGANNTSWLRYAAGNSFILIQIVCFITLLSLIPQQALNGLLHFFLRNRNKLTTLLKGLIIFFVVFLLLMQFAIGSEQGIWGIQPVEIAKLLIVIIAAHALWHLKMLRSINARYYRENRFARILLFIWVLIAFLLVSLLIAVGVHDYSPTVIVMALMAAYLWKAIPHPIRKLPLFTWSMRSFLILLPLFIVIIIGIKFYNNPPSYESSIPQAERLRIWAKPTEYPEAAAQLLKSLDRVSQGSWTGSQWFGSNKISMAIPAVQDDFIAAFLLNRFGGITGLILIIIQLLWIKTLFKLSKKLSLPQSNQNLHAAHNILGNILYGLAWLHLLHWIISWSNVLGLLPIMGQPMTWLSAGNSHLLAIGAVTLVLGMIGGWVVNR